jgi:hypothetical protein
MEQLTPKFDQIKKKYLKRGGITPRQSLVEGSMDNQKTGGVDPAAQLLALEKSSADDKKVRKITALLARVIESRQQAAEAEPPQSADEDAPTSNPVLAALSLAIQQKYTAARSARLSPVANTKSPDFATIYRGVNIAVQEGDDYELLGWFQEKAKRLGQDFSLSDAKDGRVRRCSDGTRSDATQLHDWEDLQLYLDSLKSALKKDTESSKRRGQSALENGTPSVLNALHEVSMLLIADKVRDQAEYINRLRVTVEEQAELLEVRQERLVELREKVREYGRENADLEARGEELKLDLSDALSLRYEAEERVLLLERRCQQLESEVTTRTAELLEARCALAAQVTASASASATSVRQERRPGNRLQAFEARIASHSRARGLLSDSDSSNSAASERSAETRRKAAAASRLRTDSSTSITQTSTLPRALKHLSRLSACRSSDWAQMFNQRCGSLEEMHAAEAEMLRIEGEVEAVLNRVRSAQREVKLVFNVKTSVIQKEEREKAERERVGQADNALCCICLAETKSVLLMPCRHLCVCQGCSQGPPSPQGRSPRLGPRAAANRMLRACPVCRATVAECIVVYS